MHDVFVSRAEASQEKTSVDVLVCHGNVIRYFVCRALQFDPQGWLRMAVHNGESHIIMSSTCHCKYLQAVSRSSWSSPVAGLLCWS